MPGKPGRPLSDRAHRALLAATRTLVVEHGYDGVTVAMIADAARTGRQTIYRHWPNKAELVLDAFLAHAREEVDGAAPASLTRFLEDTFAALAQTGPALRSLMAHAQRDPRFRALFRERFIAPRRAALGAVLRAGAAAGGAPTPARIEVAVSAVYGAVWYRLLLDEPLDRRYAAEVAELVRTGLRPG
jgi:AcrR family transcriptional regulator